ncbi:MAG: heme A synthase [Chloroflexi bacterium]|nr:MAG: heme A synthase [Chloroflexota bacterium]
MQVAHIRTEGGEKETAVSRQFAILSVSALVSTIILIMVGSIVRVTGNGLGCPDWPLCHGQAIPPFYLSAWVEFIHRLFGAAVVLQVGLLIFMSWRQYRSRPYIYLISKIAAVVLVIQVILGGIHVIYELPRWTGWIHTAIAMLIAGLVASWVALTNNSLRQLHQRAQQTLAHTRLIFWTTISAVATYILLLTGSLVTRTGASLVCPNFPYCGLSIIPDYLRPIVWIQMTHRYTAYIVAFTILMVLWQLLRHARQDIILRRFALTLTSLIVIQFSLGMANVLLALPMWSRVLHLGTGATIWVVMVLLTVTLRFENA